VTGVPDAEHVGRQRGFFLKKREKVGEGRRGRCNGEKLVCAVE
jgi:hypothetical protein